MAQAKKLNVKVGDQVTIISGFHKNETGEVIKVDKKTLTYTAYTATGNEYDKAIITKDFNTGLKTYQ